MLAVKQNQGEIGGVDDADDASDGPAFLASDNAHPKPLPFLLFKDKKE